MTSNVAAMAAMGQRIALAREEDGLTQAELARSVGVDRTAVAKIESGRRKVSATELVRVAAALDRPIDWFAVESPPAVVSRRQDPAVSGSSKALDRAIERLARDVEFLEADGVLPAIEVPYQRLPKNTAEAEHAASKVRVLMQPGAGPVFDLQRACERLGLLGFSLNLGDVDTGDAAYVAPVCQGGVRHRWVTVI